VALGGLVLPFALGVGATVLLGFAEGFASPQALFMGAIMTATSGGITARVLADLNRLDSPEGVTVLAAAVVDDVLGILVLTVVVGIGTAESFSLGSVGWMLLRPSPSG
jgi:Kef-type K+ transport system membrane component KefB